MLRSCEVEVQRGLLAIKGCLVVLRLGQSVTIVEPGDVRFRVARQVTGQLGVLSLRTRSVGQFARELRCLLLLPLFQVCKVRVSL